MADENKLQNGHIAHDVLVAFGDTIKAYKSKDDYTVAGYAVKYTDENMRDLEREYFTPHTETYKNNYPLVGAPVLYQHGLDQDLHIIPVGRIIEADYRDDGIFVKANINLKASYADYLKALNKPDEWLQKQLQLSDEYEERLKQLVESGQLGWSSGALPQSYKTTNGHIDQWAIIEVSLTPTPAMPIETGVVPVKSLTPINLRPIGDEVATSTIHNGDSNSNTNTPEIKNTLHEDNPMSQNKTIKMSSEELLDMLTSFVADARAMMDEMDDEKVYDDAMAMDAEDEAKMELERDEEMKKIIDSGDEELVKSIGAKRARTAFVKALKSRIETARNEREIAKQELKSELNSIKASAPPISKVTGGQMNTPRTSTTRIEVGDNLKYAHLSADEMALGVLSLDASLPASLRGKTQVVSDEYMRNFAHKVSSQLAKNPYNDVRDTIAVKSAMPFKADEIDATNIAGQGTEWVSTLYGTNLWEKARSEVQLLTLLREKGMFEQEIPQGHGSVKIPTEGSDPIAYSTPEANDLDATNRVEVTANINYFGTGNVTLTPGQIKIAAAATDELIEDSIIPVLPQMQHKMTVRALEVIESSLINGDTATGSTTNINDIAGTPDTGINRPFWLAVNGLRKYPLVTNTAYFRDANGSLDIDDWRLLAAKFTAPVQSRRQNLLYITDVYTHNSSLAIPEIATDDVRRTNATITSGILENIYGIDAYVSGFLDKSNAVGKIDLDTPANNAFGQILLVYAPFWAFGFKRNVRIDMQQDPLSGATIAVASMRFGFVARGADASAISYNVGLS